MDSDSADARPYLREHVYGAVRRLLVETAADLTEPVRVTEAGIAAKLGVSRTPVREALARLGQEGLVSFQPRRGALLRPVSRQQYFEWLDIRAELESLAARQAAMNAGQSDVNKLRAIFAPFDATNLADQLDAYALANVEFHDALMALSRNTLLPKIWSLFGHRQMSRTGTIARLGRMQESLAQHHAMIDAIEARDPQRAADLARAHVESLRRQITDAPPDFPLPRTAR